MRKEQIIFRAVLRYNTDEHACYECGLKDWKSLTSAWHTTRKAAEKEFWHLQNKADSIRLIEERHPFGCFEQEDICIEEAVLSIDF